MTKAEYIIHCQTAHGMSLDDAKVEADQVFAKSNTTQAPVVPTVVAPEPPKELTPQAKKAQEQAQQAVYPGQLRRIRRLTQEKLKARKFFDRAKMFM